MVSDSDVHIIPHPNLNALYLSHPIFLFNDPPQPINSISTFYVIHQLHGLTILLLSCTYTYLFANHRVRCLLQAAYDEHAENYKFKLHFPNQIYLYLSLLRSVIYLS